ncbi:hypothetical protein [Massilia sp. S19_KUP03_FR1]|uniref:hypothetical protein n=1 Tax=Massilia sp. S19_KUP03_FR1 TaxID=3025503 RepID=UPI002FCD905D
MNCPDRAACRCLLANGSFATVTATRRPRAGRADVKCSGVPGLAERMQQVVRLARHTEPRIDSRDQVVLSIDIDPGTRDWELAAVLADRMVRGLVHLNEPCANGWSDQWQLGRIDGHTIDADPPALLGGAGGMAHLGALTGQPDAAHVVSSARAWFPLHSGGINDSLCWVEVSVYPLLAGDLDDDAVTVPGLDVTRQLAVRQALLGARDFDRCVPGRWRTTIRFGQQRFQGNSYELALVLADRLARGRDYVARGRIIASGTSHGWHTGQVDTVEGIVPKCALIAAEAAPGDRILLPQAWQTMLPPEFADAVRARGASLACVAQIGIF